MLPDIVTLLSVVRKILGATATGEVLIPAGSVLLTGDVCRSQSSDSCFRPYLSVCCDFRTPTCCDERISL